MTRNSNPGGHAVIVEQTEQTTTEQGDGPSEEFQRFENLAGKLVQTPKSEIGRQRSAN